MTLAAGGRRHARARLAVGLPGLAFLGLALLLPATGCRKNRTHGLEPPPRGDCLKAVALLERHTRREAASYAELRPVRPGEHEAAAALVGRMKDHYVGLCMRHTAAAASCMVESQSLDELFGCQKQIFMGAPAVASTEMPANEARVVLEVFTAAAQATATERLERLVAPCADRTECAGSCGPALRELLAAVSAGKPLPGPGCPDLNEVSSGPSEQAGERLFAWVSRRWELLAGRARPALGAAQRAALDRAMYGLDRSGRVPVDYRMVEGRPRPFVYGVVVPSWGRTGAAPSARPTP